MALTEIERHYMPVKMDKWINFIWVFIGGGTGAVLRMSLDAAITRQLRGMAFPLGIATVNLLGCLFIGLLYGWLMKERMAQNEWIVPLLGIGLLGGFTTFSTFGMQTVMLLKEGRTGVALAYVLVSVLGGILLAALGYWATNR